jgi:hypothetical protein
MNYLVLMKIFVWVFFTPVAFYSLRYIYKHPKKRIGWKRKDVQMS